MYNYDLPKLHLWHHPMLSANGFSIAYPCLTKVVLPPHVVLEYPKQKSLYDLSVHKISTNILLPPYTALSFLGALKNFFDCF